MKILLLTMESPMKISLAIVFLYYFCFVLHIIYIWSIVRAPWPEIGGLAFAVVVGAAVVEPQPVLAPGTSALAAGHLASLVATLETVALRRLRRALLQHLSIRNSTKLCV